MPRLKSVAFETAILEQYQHQESSVEEALIEMCLAGVSAQRLEAITEAVWGTKVSPGTISNLSKKVYGHIEKWRGRRPVGQSVHEHEAPGGHLRGRPHCRPFSFSQSPAFLFYV